MANSDEIPDINPWSDPSDPKPFDISEREGLQLDRKRNYFQLSAVILLAVIGATIGWFLADERPDIVALIGGVVGVVLGTFVSGLVIMFYDYPYSRLQLLQIPDVPMTGLDHLYYQAQRAGWALLYLAFVTTLGWAYLFLVPQPAFPGFILISMFVAIPLVLILCRPRCPFCRFSLLFMWRKGVTPYHNYCPHCGAKFAANLDQKDDSK
ncbi:MAG: hypothetical protein COA78_05490 [Blastopirellula sp.]|nr:MAG: hypothetical protein COA78_05490 [Blastopirellula sp.]